MKKILIIRFSALGDLVTFEPHCRAIRHFFPESKITMLTTPLGKSLYHDSGYFNDFVMYDGFFKTLGLLKEKQFDLVVNLQCNKLSHYLCMMLPEERVVHLSSNLFQRIFKLPHHTKDVCEMLTMSGCDYDAVREYCSDKSNLLVQLPFNSEGYERLFKPEDTVVAISTGSSEKWVSKKWGLERYMALIDMLVERGIKVLLVGTKLELGDAKAITEKFGHNVVSVVDQTNISQLKSALGQAGLFVGNDSGPAHIAAGVGLNTVTIFGSTDIKHCVKHMPYRGVHTCLKPTDEVACHPCYKSVCPTQHECMVSIEPSQVFNAIEELLDV